MSKKSFKDMCTTTRRKPRDTMMARPVDTTTSSVQEEMADKVTKST